MKMKLFTTLLFISLFTGLNAQTNKATITYTLQRTFVEGLTSVGGSLIVDDPNAVPLCTDEIKSIQSVYTGKRLASTFLNVNNTAGAGCVTIIVTSSGRELKQTIPAGGESGILSFSNVTKVVITIDHKTSTILPQTVNATGSVDFWF